MPIIDNIDLLRRHVFDIREAGKGNPRIHPNGFIQLDLASVDGDWHSTHQVGHSGASKRLHIWNPPGFELPHQQTVNEIHDHVFDMLSHVIKGALGQMLYWFVVGSAEENTHEIYRAVYGKGADSRLEASGVTGNLKLASTEVIGAGDSYVQPAFTLHDSAAGDQLVVTVMEKTDIHDGNPIVICPITTPPDNSFDRQDAAPAEYLWNAIEASLIA